MSNLAINTVDAALSLGGTPTMLVSLRIEECLSRETRAQAQIASLSPLDSAAVCGSEAEVVLLLDGKASHRFKLVVGSIAFLNNKRGTERYELTLFSPMWQLQHTRNLRKFRNLSAKDIITQVLGEGGIAHRWNISREPPVRKYCVQYRESNFDFVSRLLEFEGIYYVTEEDGSITLSDSSPTANFIPGENSFTLLETAGGLHGKPAIHAFGWGNRVGTGKVTLNDYSWKTPDVSLLKTATGARDTELELYDYPAGYRKPGQGAEFSQLRLDAARARSRFARGRSSVSQLGAGRKLLFDGEEILLLEVTHEIEFPAFGQDQDSDIANYRNRFEAIPSAVPFRPPIVTPEPHIDGCHTAMVRGPAGEEIHTDRFGRFRAQFHWDREATGSDDDSRWLRKLQESATSINLARVGWEVNVVYIDGDPDRPIGLTRKINGAMVPAYGQPGNKEVMTIKTPTYPASAGGYNEIRLDDRGGSQTFNVRAERDFINRVLNDKTETIGNNQTHLIDAQLNHRVDRDQTLAVGGNQTTSVDRDIMLKVDGDRSETVGGNQSIKTGGSLTVTVNKNQTERVGAVRLSIVKNRIQRGAEEKLSRVVGGLHVAAAGEAINYGAQYLHAETVGGLKLTVAKKGIAQTAGKLMTHTVGGAIFRKSKGDAGYGAEMTKVTVGGLVNLDAGERLEITGREILLQAAAKLELKQGDLAFELTPSKITALGTLRLNASEKVSVTGSDDNLTKG